MQRCPRGSGVQRRSPSVSPGCDYHASLVIGRRKDPDSGKCQFLVRNSWGTGCDGYRQAGWDCEHGNIWVDEAALKVNLTEVYYLESK